MILAADGLLSAACVRPALPDDMDSAVKVMTVDLGSFNSGCEFAGKVKAQIKSRLGFRVGGKIIKRQAELGQRVKAGQILAQLDPQNYKLAGSG